MIDNTGIVHKGDGSNVYVHGSHVMTPLLGDSDVSRLVAPVSLASSADGSLYIGDLRVIHRLTPTNQRFTHLIQHK